MKARRFPGQRALHIGVRTIHIATAGVTLGAATLGVDPGSWAGLALLSGLVLLADDLFRYGDHWLRFVQAWAILLKLALLGLGMARPEWMAASLWAAVVVGGVISHAPGEVRQRALWGEDGPCAKRRATGEACRAPAREVA